MSDITTQLTMTTKPIDLTLVPPAPAADGPPTPGHPHVWERPAEPVEPVEPAADPFAPLDPAADPAAAEAPAKPGFLRLKPGAPIAPAIRANLADAQAKLDGLLREHGDIALEAALGTPGAAGKLADIDTEIATLRAKVATLSAALSAAEARDAATIRAQRAAIQRTQINAVKAHLGRRNNAAARFASAIEEAARQWKLLLEHSHKAQAANPIGGAWPTGSLCDLPALRHAVEREMWRVGGDAAIGGKAALPGGNAHEFQNRHDPAGLPKLADVLKTAADATVAELEGRPRG